MVFKFNMKQIVAGPQVYRISQKENFLQMIKKLNSDSESVRSGLSAFLEKKREYFPRLFFISNEELIDIFSRADDIIEKII